VFKEVPLKHGCCDPRVNTAFLIMLDFVVVFVIWQIMVLFCTLLVWLCDWNRVRDKYFSPDAPHFGIDYLCGLLLFFFVLGIFGIIIGTIKLFQWMCSSGSKEPVNYSYDTYPYYNTWEIWVINIWISNLLSVLVMVVLPTLLLSWISLSPWNCTLCLCFSRLS
jgi:hypothetical protein